MKSVFISHYGFIERGPLKFSIDKESPTGGLALKKTESSPETEVMQGQLQIIAHCYKDTSSIKTVKEMST